MMSSYAFTLVTVLPRACGVGARTHFARKFMEHAIVLKSPLSSIRLAFNAESSGGTTTEALPIERSEWHAMSMPSLGDNVVSDGAAILMFSQIRKNKEKQDDPSVTDGSQSHKFILL